MLSLVLPVHACLLIWCRCQLRYNDAVDSVYINVFTKYVNVRCHLLLLEAR